MLNWIIQITISSLFSVILLHYIIDYLKDVMTIPKIKDLVENPSKKYKNMYNIINRNIHNSSSSSSSSSTSYSTIQDYTLNDLLVPIKDEITQHDKFSMKDELKNFLKKQLNETPDENHDSKNLGTSISTLDTINETSSFSNY